MNDSNALAVIDVTVLAPLAAMPAATNPADVYLQSKAPGSRRTLEQSLHSIAALLTGGKRDAFTLDWGAVRYEHAAVIRAELAERHAPATANKMLSAFRGVLKEAWRLGQMPTEEYHRAVDLPNVKGSTLPAGRHIPAGEMRALFSACNDATRGGARDAAILAVLYGAGAREAEAMGLDLGDYNRETGELRIRHGKGNKDRTGYATNGSRNALEAWLDIHGDAPGPLLVPVLKSGRVVIRRMSNQTVMDVVLKRSAMAGIVDISPHDFRRTFISDLLDAGVDISTVQQMVGHASVNTTARYDRRGEVAKQKAAELLYVPWQG